MISPARIAELAASERGAVLVTFALFAPVVILMAAFTMDAGNWFLHKRHLQVQADAAVKRRASNSFVLRSRKPAFLTPMIRQPGPACLRLAATTLDFSSATG